MGEQADYELEQAMCDLDESEHGERTLRAIRAQSVRCESSIVVGALFGSCYLFRGHAGTHCALISDRKFRWDPNG